MCLPTARPSTMLNVHLTSKEIIKPSSPTPAHLRTMPLSIADQLGPDIYIQAILFYPADGAAAADKAALLKDSLSTTLKYFHPLAGRLSGDIVRADVHVDCNDQGAAFYEATVDCHLDTVLQRPPMGEMYKLMPNNGANMREGDPLLAVQLNVFACGGLALGVCISHQVADAASMSLFLNSWTEVARGGELGSPPRFHAASVLPPANLPYALVPRKVAGSLPKRFVIRAPEMDRLREETGYARVQHPTRVEAVSALLWRCVLRARPKVAAEDQDDSRKIPVALINVNLRKKMPEELSDLSFGSLITWAFVVDDSAERINVSEREQQAGYVEKSMRDAVRSVNGDFVREQVEGFLSGQTLLDEATMDTMEFSSWCRFPFYDMDFGWGGPAWYCSVMKDLVNLAVLADTKDGKGVEMWVWLPEEDMERFQRDPELLAFVDPDSISF